LFLRHLHGLTSGTERDSIISLALITVEFASLKKRLMQDIWWFAAFSNKWQN
jgi:hypothetical protein